MEANCVKCQSKKRMRNPKAIAMTNWRLVTQGVCAVCSTKMFRIGKAGRVLHFPETTKSCRKERRGAEGQSQAGERG